MALNRLIVDTDGGDDDAQALLLLIAAGRTPHAVTTVYGNVDLDVGTGNVLGMLWSYATFSIRLPTVPASRMTGPSRKPCAAISGIMRYL